MKSVYAKKNCMRKTDEYVVATDMHCGGPVIVRGCPGDLIQVGK